MDALFVYLSLLGLRGATDSKGDREWVSDVDGSIPFAISFKVDMFESSIRRSSSTSD